MTTSPNQAQTQTSYDSLPYLFESHYLTHPDRLASTGTLFGMAPAPVEHCRVLELGCASGGNLLPMAYNLPESQFTGIDLSQSQITRGKEMASFLGLKNISSYPTV
jgi:tRNA G46 methylase TrmB